ncbi:M20 family metallopeptidase [soil metagenome]
MKTLSLSVATALLCGASSAYAAAPAAPATPAAAAIEASIRHDWPALDALYKDLHANPELGFQERRTAALLAAKMRALGFTVTEGVGGTGIVALYRNGAGPVVMVRTELDALPMQEKNGLPYASQVQATGADGSKSFVAHSCGHDNHMAWWLGTAEALLAMKDRWHGTLMFIGQPSEETVQGAKAMIADGLLTRFPKPDYAFAAHVGSAPAGTVSVKDGVVSSNSDSAEVIFHGRGAHGSMPSASIDPVVMGAHFVSDVQSVISRQKEAGTFGVVTVGSFQSGTVGNIIPDTATLKLSLRSFAPDVRALLRDGVTRTANAVAAMAAAPAPEIKWRTGTSAVVDDHALVDKVGAALRAGDATDSIELVPATVPGWSASEDFSAFVEAGVPGVYFSIGGYDPAVIKAYEAKGEPVPTNHSPYFAPDHDKAIPTGIRTLTLAVLAVAG